MQSPESGERLLHCLLFSTQGTLHLRTVLIAEHSHVGLFLLIMRWGALECHRETSATVSALCIDKIASWLDWVGGPVLVVHSIKNEC